MDCHFLLQEIFPTQGLNALAGRYFITKTPGRPSSFYQFLAILGTQFSGVSPLISASLFTWLSPLCVSVFVFSSLKSTSHWIRSHPKLV